MTLYSSHGYIDVAYLLSKGWQRGAMYTNFAQLMTVIKKMALGILLLLAVVQQQQIQHCSHHILDKIYDSFFGTPLGSLLDR